MNLIVAADRNWGIGNKGDLLVRIPADHKMFRQETVGKVVVLGRKTMDTFPGGRPLKDRTNIVLTRNPSYQNGDAVIVHSVKELLETLKAYDSDDVYIIGGTSVYEQLLPYCDTAHVTGSITFMKRIPASLIWIGIRSGRSRRTATNSTIST